MIDATQLTEVAADKALKSQKPRAIEPGRYTSILEPRANAALPVADDRASSTRARPKAPVGNYFSGKERGHDQGRREAVQRQLHAQERHRQPDPAAVADRHRRHGRASR